MPLQPGTTLGPYVGAPTRRLPAAPWPPAVWQRTLRTASGSTDALCPPVRGGARWRLERRILRGQRRWSYAASGLLLAVARRGRFLIGTMMPCAWRSPFHPPTPAWTAPWEQSVGTVSLASAETDPEPPGGEPSNLTRPGLPVPPVRSLHTVCPSEAVIGPGGGIISPAVRRSKPVRCCDCECHTVKA